MRGLAQFMRMLASVCVCLHLSRVVLLVSRRSSRLASVCVCLHLSRVVLLVSRRSSHLASFFSSHVVRLVSRCLIWPALFFSSRVIPFLRRSSCLASAHVKGSEFSSLLASVSRLLASACICLTSVCVCVRLLASVSRRSSCLASSPCYPLLTSVVLSRVCLGHFG